MKYLHSFVLAACAFAWLGCRGFASAGGLCGGACLAGTWLAVGLGLGLGLGVGFGLVLGLGLGLGLELGLGPRLGLGSVLGLRLRLGLRLGFGGHRGGWRIRRRCGRSDAERLERCSDRGLQQLRRLEAVEQLADIELE